MQTVPRKRHCTCTKMPHVGFSLKKKSITPFFNSSMDDTLIMMKPHMNVPLALRTNRLPLIILPFHAYVDLIVLKLFLVIRYLSG